MSAPETEAGRALSIRRAHQNGVNLMDKAAMAVVNCDILAIEREGGRIGADAALAEAIRRVEGLLNPDYPASRDEGLVAAAAILWDLADA